VGAEDAELSECKLGLATYFDHFRPFFYCLTSMAIEETHLLIGEGGLFDQGRVHVFRGQDGEQVKRWPVRDLKVVGVVTRLQERGHAIVNRSHEFIWLSGKNGKGALPMVRLWIFPKFPETRLLLLVIRQAMIYWFRAPLPQLAMEPGKKYPSNSICGNQSREPIFSQRLMSRSKRLTITLSRSRSRSPGLTAETRLCPKLASQYGSRKPSRDSC
jgi:hypothetical protein